MEKILLDMHTHSSHSPDADDSASAMCEKAAELGLRAYALTDHCDVNFWEEAPSPETIDAMMYGAGRYALASIAEQTELRERFAEKFDLIVGIELGQPMQNIEKAELIANDSRLDFIIGSHHMNAGVDDFYYLDYSKMSAEELDHLLCDCFEQTLEMCQWGKFDVLGHLTYSLRYICGEYGIDVSLEKYEEVIREIFGTLISKGKGIEINTSGLRQKYGQTFPTFELVKLYRQLGGEILTIGSDAHRTADLGKGISEGIVLAKEAGFDMVTYFKNHEPHFLKL
ncbi:histidinol-phosphatase HisJ family protein [Ruminococcus sp.]|uniref:histidinol-phosphatase HisJ family protein n=1 Tax=Ruminococcus sp. TaxID=41978 RepID=UPI0025F871EA|nr:histidinol-phosphatase HisJ family protein [Ruminococcus sp.]MBQ9540774.1 histidinol-phosphatase HisJ family protein [Ruminococcus sp.]